MIIDLPFPHYILMKIVKVIILLIFGLIIAKFIKYLVQNLINKYRSDHRPSFFPNFVFYFIIVLTVILALDQVDIDLKLLLGTAGFLTVALGFASQTSVSNIISGVFLMTEKPFIIGDTVKINDLTGEILSIDMLSTRIRTFDNLLVRIPNESLMKANIINFTFFPIRRVDIKFKVSPQENLILIKDVLFKVSEKDDLCFDEPRPVYLIESMLELGIMIQFSFWVKKENYNEAKNQFIEKLQQQFLQHQINWGATFFDQPTTSLKKW